MLSGVVVAEHSDQSVHGRDEGVVVYDTDPLGVLIALAIEQLNERKVALSHVVVLIQRCNEGSLDAKIAHVGLQLGHLLLVWVSILFRSDDDDEEMSISVREPTLEEWY